MVADVTAVIRLDELVLARELLRQDACANVPVQGLDAAVQVGVQVAEMDGWRLDRLAGREDPEGRIDRVGTNAEKGARIASWR